MYKINGPGELNNVFDVRHIHISKDENKTNKNMERMKINDSPGFIFFLTRYRKQKY